MDDSSTRLFSVGSSVYFGRPNGEKTRGEITKVNPRSYRIKQLEERGGHEIGTMWTVPHTLCSTAPESSPVMTKLQARPIRPDMDILLDIASTYSRLSPENLAADGERPRSQIKILGAHLRRQLQALFIELGRKVDEDEAYRLTQNVRFPNRASTK